MLVVPQTSEAHSYSFVWINDTTLPLSGMPFPPLFYQVVSLHALKTLLKTHLIQDELTN